MKLYTLFSKNWANSHRWPLNLFLLFLLSGPTFVFTMPSEFEGQRPIHAFEFLSYRSGDGEKTFLEIFSQIPTNNLIFVKFEDGFFASYELSITLYDQLDNQVVSMSFIDSVKVQTFRDIDLYRPPQLLHLPLFLEPGDYKTRVRLTDLETLKPRVLQKNITIPAYNNSDLQLSDLQIAISITESKGGSVLVKNNRKVVPNVLRIVGTRELKVLYVYSELYNLQYRSEEPNHEFIATYVIKNEKGIEVKSITRKYKKPGDTCVLSERIRVDELEAGQYQLILIVEDLDTAQTFRKSTNFYVVKPRPELNI